MDTERLGLTPEQQASIDAVLLQTTVDALNQKGHYHDRALLMASSPDLPNELEAIHTRTYSLAHDTIIADQEHAMASAVITNLGLLAFIDTLALPSSEKLGGTTKRLFQANEKRGRTDVERAIGEWRTYRRLFRGLVHTEPFDVTELPAN